MGCYKHSSRRSVVCLNGTTEDVSLVGRSHRNSRFSADRDAKLVNQLQVATVAEMARTSNPVRARPPLTSTPLYAPFGDDDVIGKLMHTFLVYDWGNVEVASGTARIEVLSVEGIVW